MGGRVIQKGEVMRPTQPVSAARRNGTGYIIAKYLCSSRGVPYRNRRVVNVLVNLLTAISRTHPMLFSRRKGGLIRPTPPPMAPTSVYGSGSQNYATGILF